MNYRLTVNDDMGWVISITELLNNDTTLVLNVDFKPKYLSINDCMSIHGDIEEYGILFISNENTLNYEKHGAGEILIRFDDNVEVEHTAQNGRYNSMIFFVKTDHEKIKEVYPMK